MNLQKIEGTKSDHGQQQIRQFKQWFEKYSTCAYNDSGLADDFIFDVIRKRDKFVVSFKEAFEVEKVNFYYGFMMDAPIDVVFFLELLKRGRLPDGFSFRSIVDESSGKEMLLDDGFSIASEEIELKFYRSSEIDVYELLGTRTHVRGIDCILVIEIELKEILFMGVSSVNELVTQSSEYENKVAYEIIPYIYGSGYFYTNSAVIDDLKTTESIESDALRDQVLTLINLCSKHQSFNKAASALGWNSEKLDSTMQKLNELKISPITIPEQWYLYHMLNPLNILRG